MEAGQVLVMAKLVGNLLNTVLMGVQQDDIGVDDTIGEDFGFGDGGIYNDQAMGLTQGVKWGVRGCLNWLAREAG
jgi:hypothetical protein